MTAEPATATAARLVLEPERRNALAMAWPTWATSAIFFSTTALGGSGSSASASTRKGCRPLRARLAAAGPSSSSLTAAEPISMPSMGAGWRANPNIAPRRCRERPLNVSHS